LAKLIAAGNRWAKVMASRLARKLAIFLWRFVELGLVPDGAILNSRVAAKVR
jgi:hypothetical protein